MDENQQILEWNQQILSEISGSWSRIDEGKEETRVDNYMATGYDSYSKKLCSNPILMEIKRRKPEFALKYQLSCNR